MQSLFAEKIPQKQKKPTAIAFSCTHLKAISSKVNAKVHAKLQNIKCTTHKTKSTDAVTAVKTQLATTNATNIESSDIQSETTAEPKLIIKEQAAASERNYNAIDGENTNTKSADTQSAGALITFSIVTFVLEAVVWVVIKVLDCICAQVMLCFFL